LKAQFYYFHILAEYNLDPSVVRL